ncbi:MAG: PilZ domain-containing protein [Spirochaetales bacterium]|nr:PilZ domain-containing protein [Spirochaetales bacterium]
MGKEGRIFTRVKAQLEIDYEFVDWRETQLAVFVSPKKTHSFDISANGIGFREIEGVNPVLLKQLEKGKKKVKLAIHLDKNRPPLMTFARLVWGAPGADGHKSFGFMFIEVSQVFFNEVNRYVQTHLSAKEK